MSCCNDIAINTEAIFHGWITAEKNCTGMNNDNYWMQQAVAQARLAAEQGEVPVGAVLVRDNQLIAAGYNQPILSHDPSAHAEIVALRAAGEVLENYRMLDTTLYVTLEPCIMCCGAMVHARVGRLVFGAYDTRRGVAGSQFDGFNLPWLNHRVEVEGGVLEAECSALLQDFFRSRR